MAAILLRENAGVEDSAEKRFFFFGGDKVSVPFFAQNVCSIDKINYPKRARRKLRRQGGDDLVSIPNFVVGDDVGWMDRGNCAIKHKFNRKLGLQRLDEGRHAVGEGEEPLRFFGALEEAAKDGAVGLFPIVQCRKAGTDRELADVACVNAERNGIEKRFGDARTKAARGEVVDRFVFCAGANEEFAQERWDKAREEGTGRAEAAVGVEVAGLRRGAEDGKIEILKEREEMRTAAELEGAGPFFKEEAVFAGGLDPAAEPILLLEKSDVRLRMFFVKKPGGAEAGDAAADD